MVTIRGTIGPLMAVVCLGVVSAPSAAVVPFCSDRAWSSKEAISESLGHLLDQRKLSVAESNLPKLRAVDLTSRNRALVAASQLGRISLVRQLIASGAQTNWRDDNEEFMLTPLLAAAWCNRIEVIQELLGAGANPNMTGIFPFAAPITSDALPLYASIVGPEYRGGKLEIFSMLLDAGADPKILDGLGNDAAHYLGTTPISDKFEYFKALKQHEKVAN